MISDWSRELRCPFLDERVAHCAAQHALGQLCNVRDGAEGSGEKHVLRRVARRLGIARAARHTAHSYRRLARGVGAAPSGRGQGAAPIVALVDDR
jgi:asparagine synthetase B (glutamine-hydrolysing)